MELNLIFSIDNEYKPECIQNSEQLQPLSKTPCSDGIFPGQPGDMGGGGGKKNG